MLERVDVELIGDVFNFIIRLEMYKLGKLFNFMINVGVLMVLFFLSGEMVKEKLSYLFDVIIMFMGKILFINEMVFELEW